MRRVWARTGPGLSLIVSFSVPSPTHPIPAFLGYFIKLAKLQAVGRKSTKCSSQDGRLLGDAGWSNEKGCESPDLGDRIARATLAYARGAEAAVC